MSKLISVLCTLCIIYTTITLSNTITQDTHIHIYTGEDFTDSGVGCIDDCLSTTEAR